MDDEWDIIPDDTQEVKEVYRELRKLITKLLLESKEVPQEIKDFCGYGQEGEIYV